MLTIMPNGIQSFCFAVEFCLCISAIMKLYFLYVKQKLSCKPGSNKVFFEFEFEYGWHK